MVWSRSQMWNDFINVIDSPSLMYFQYRWQLGSWPESSIPDSLSRNAECSTSSSGTRMLRDMRQHEFSFWSLIAQKLMKLLPCRKFYWLLHSTKSSQIRTTRINRDKTSLSDIKREAKIERLVIIVTRSNDIEREVGAIVRSDSSDHVEWQWSIPLQLIP